MINLLKNALKFTVNGKIKVNITYDNGSELLKVSVQDTGAGIKDIEQS